MAFKDPEAERLYYATYRAAHREKQRAYNKAWHVAHRAKALATAAARHAAHREKDNAKTAAYYVVHRERLRVQGAARYLENPEAVCAESRAWRQEHPEEAAAQRRRYRARKAAAAINDLSAAQWQELQVAYDHCCAYCGKRAKGHLTQDHITPLSQGGNHTLSNVVPACQACNFHKHTGPPLSPVQPLLLTLAPLKQQRRKT